MSKHVERNLLKYNIFGYIMIPSSKRNLGKHPKEVKLMGLKGMKRKIQIEWIMCKAACISCGLFPCQREVKKLKYTIRKEV